MSYKHPYIAIFGAGRSGTTSLQNLLNSDPSILIRGENNNFFYETFRAYRSLHKLNNGTTRSHPWFGFEHFKPDKYLEVTRELSHNFLTGGTQKDSTKVIGFKEISLFNLFNTQGPKGLRRSIDQANHTPEKELEDFIQYLKKLFPGLKVVFLKRNPKEIANSGWWKNRIQYDFDILAKDLRTYHKACRKLSNSNGDIFLNHKALRAKDLQVLRKKLYRSLDLPFCEERAIAALDQELIHSKWPHLTTKD